MIGRWMIDSALPSIEKKFKLNTEMLSGRQQKMESEAIFIVVYHMSINC